MTAPGEADQGFEALLEFLSHSRGVDFTAYKRPSLERRFRRRMDAVEAASYADYVDYLEVHPEEYEQLLDTLLINVTEFFRDPPIWDFLRERVVPELIEGWDGGEPIRVWSAGCATGQEAYSVAMVLAEALGADGLRERAKIYATDIDDDALAVARHAVYGPRDVESIPHALRERYFEPVDHGLRFRKELRRSVIFGRNDLLSDAPISRLDLIVCRNTLMYFTAEAQGRILRHFQFALRPGGTLLLGKSEMMLSHRELFAPLDVRLRVFRKAERPPGPARIGDLPAGEPLEAAPGPDERRLREAALDAGAPPLLLVSRSGLLAFANRSARALFRIGVEHVGRPLAELDPAFRPVAMRGAIDEALRDRRPVPAGQSRHVRDGDGERRLEVTVTPLLADGESPLGVAVAFDDVTRTEELREELSANRRDLELAYEELQSTIDELETTNEELQSANEELQTTNEELQSTNEELETMNEELQSTNEELEAINDELRDRTSELDQVNRFFEAVLSTLGVGVAVLDAQGRVLVWSGRAEDLWGVRREEVVARHFVGLDIGLPVDRVVPALRQVLTAASPREELSLEAVNRRGRAFVCATTVLPLTVAGYDGQPGGALVVMAETGG